MQVESGKFTKYFLKTKIFSNNPISPPHWYTLKLHHIDYAFCHLFQLALISGDTLRGAPSSIAILRFVGITLDAYLLRKIRIFFKTLRMKILFNKTNFTERLACRALNILNMKRPLKIVSQSINDMNLWLLWITASYLHFVICFPRIDS